jgi:hypothetical protein
MGTKAFRVMAPAAGDHEQFLLPLQRCNKNGNGGTALPARARFDVPWYSVDAAAGLNRGLQGVPVVFVGSLPDGYDPKRVDDPPILWSAYACRVVDAPAAP